MSFSYKILILDDDKLVTSSLKSLFLLEDFTDVVFFNSAKEALEYLKDNDECFVYLSSCIGKSELPSACIKTVKNGTVTESQFQCALTPKEMIDLFKLKEPNYTRLCLSGISGVI